jgi:hypothetical protein
MGKKHKHESPLETKVEASIRIVKFVAPKAITINGYPSPCECTETITCAYCIQASLIGFERKLEDNDERKKKIISHIKKNGIRKTAKEIDAQPSTVQYWFRTGNFPPWVLNKYAGCTNDNANIRTP